VFRDSCGNIGIHTVESPFGNYLLADLGAFFIKMGNTVDLQWKTKLRSQHAMERTEMWRGGAPNRICKRRWDRGG